MYGTKDLLSCNLKENKNYPNWGSGSEEPGPKESIVSLLKLVLRVDIYFKFKRRGESHLGTYETNNTWQIIGKNNKL